MIFIVFPFGVGCAERREKPSEEKKVSKVLDYGVLREEISKENMLAMAELIAGKECRCIYGYKIFQILRRD